MKPTAVVDVEIFPNYLLVGFKNIVTGKVTMFEKSKDHGLDFDRAHLQRVMMEAQTIGFNSINFDLALIFLAIRNFSEGQIKLAANKIINANYKPWDIEKEYGIQIPRNLDHIDLIEVMPTQASLKTYGGKLHAPRIQDLPFEHDARLTMEQIVKTRNYWNNDADTTIIAYCRFENEIKLRERMSAEYDVDLRSKSDAQIAEAVIRKEVLKITGVEPKRPIIEPGTIYRFPMPSFIKPQTSELKEVVDAVAAAEFVVAPSGKIDLPKVLSDAKIRIGQGVYRMGIGGLHSSEQRIAYRSDETHVLLDRDVTSYYPAIILNLGLYPKHIGPEFLRVFASIRDRRVAAKKAGDKTTANSLKIVANGAFGKLGSKWSALFAPDLMITTTLCGQLSLLMLIERIELAGFHVISANTDGVVTYVPRTRRADFEAVVAQWERDTAFGTEETEYEALYARDVNNYIAIKPDGSLKKKGAYADPEPVASSWPAPANQICVEAAVARIRHGTPVRETIEACRDVRQFVTIRKVAGGAFKDGEPLGRTVRWIYSTATKTPISQRGGDKVPKTDGARPLMELPADFPPDVDYDRYVKEANRILDEIGFAEMSELILEDMF